MVTRYTIVMVFGPYLSKVGYKHSSVVCKCTFPFVYNVWCTEIQPILYCHHVEPLFYVTCMKSAGGNRAGVIGAIVLCTNLP